MSFEVQGLKELDQKLVELGKKSARKVMRAAVRSAGSPILKAAKGLAKRIGDSGVLARSLKSKVKAYGGTIVAIIGPDHFAVGTGSDGRRQVPTKIAHLVEFGTRPHVQPDRGGVIHPGSRQQPFMRPAWDTKKNEALAVIQRRVAEGIEKEAAKR
jgi:HK97 gp10 family phage protein